MANQLQQLVKNTGETEKKLGSINETLVKLYGVETKHLKLTTDKIKEDNKKHKREEQDKKKTIADKVFSIKKEEKEKKEDKKSLLENIGEGLKKALGPIGSLLQGLGGILTTIGTTVMGTLAGFSFSALAAPLAAALGVGIMAYLYNHRGEIGKWWKDEGNKATVDVFQGIVTPGAGGELKEMRSRTWAEASSQVPMPWQEGYGEMEHKKVTGGKMVDLLGEEQNLNKEIKELEKKLKMPDLELEKHKPLWFMGDVTSYRESLTKDKNNKETKVSKVGSEINELTPEIQKLFPGMEIEKRQRGGMSGVRGMIPTMVESGEALIPANHPNAAMGLMMNSLIPRFNKGGEVGGTETTAIDTMFNMAQGFGSMISTVWEGLGITDMLGGIFNTVTGAAGDMLGGIGTATTDIIGNMFGGPSTSAGSTAPPGNAKEYYNIMTEEMGMDAIHAKGLLANMIRESSLKTTNPGDGGTSNGLFQWHAGRLTKARQALGQNWNDPRAQIEYALREPGEPGPEYKAKSFSSAQQAADWWMKHWERPAHPKRDSRRHTEILNGLGFQSGGAVGAQQGGGIGNLSAAPNQMNSRLSDATKKFANEIAATQGGPIVVVQDEPAPNLVTTGTMDQDAPDLMDYTSVPAATNYMFYDLNYGPVA